MKLVPFILTQKNNHRFETVSLSVFLCHAGKTIWKSDEPGLLSEKTILTDYCEPNGFAVNKIYMDKEKQIAFIDINKEKTAMSDFYSWEEALSNSTKPECWRRYFFFTQKGGGDWWSPKGMVEAEIQDYGNVADLFQEIKDRCRS